MGIFKRSSPSKPTKPTTPSSAVLTQEERSFFLTHGFVKIPSCFSRSTADEFTSSLWERLGYSPTDRSSWTKERIYLPSTNCVPIETFAPKAWSAICEILGGEERVSPHTRGWTDGFIVNLGREEYEGKSEKDMQLKGEELDNWHVDGNWFYHFLDSWEQGLLIVPLFSDIKAGGGGTVVCSDSIGAVARYLYEHPEGVDPGFKPRGSAEEFDFWGLIVKSSIARKESLHEVTGEIGDVFLLHPLLLHSAAKNFLRSPRIITNPVISLKEPFDLNRKNASEYSLVEQKTLQELGKPQGVGGWRITGARELIK